MVEDTLKEFIEKHIDLIEQQNFKKLYTIIDSEENYDGEYSMYHNAGKLTDLFYKIGVDPLKGSDEIYPNMFVRSEIDHFDFPQGIKKLGTAAFYSCRNLNTIVIPEGVTAIPYECFAETYLEWIQIPDSVQMIDAGAFEYDNLFYIKCNLGSHADEWAKDHDIVVEYLS